MGNAADAPECDAICIKKQNNNQFEAESWRIADLTSQSQ